MNCLAVVLECSTPMVVVFCRLEAWPPRVGAARAHPRPDRICPAAHPCHSLPDHHEVTLCCACSAESHAILLPGHGHAGRLLVPLDSESWISRIMSLASRSGTVLRTPMDPLAAVNHDCFAIVTAFHFRICVQSPWPASHVFQLLRLQNITRE
ncbi:hypothetical protein IQ07DRAFT_418854 [Pyrenochaeta sp. DS3sAY3a]|nr:hypothetical protein IQ07DRAFT_418854 [Pyrenochaeta sp. DS3sAY3a]